MSIDPTTNSPHDRFVQLFGEGSDAGDADSHSAGQPVDTAKIQRIRRLIERGLYEPHALLAACTERMLVDLWHDPLDG